MKLVLALIASLGIASAFAQTAAPAKKEETKKTPADKVEATAPAAAKPVAAPTAAPAAPAKEEVKLAKKKEDKAADATKSAQPVKDKKATDKAATEVKPATATK